MSNVRRAGRKTPQKVMRPHKFVNFQHKFSTNSYIIGQKRGRLRALFSFYFIIKNKNIFYILFLSFIIKYTLCAAKRLALFQVFPIYFIYNIRLQELSNV